MDIAVRHFENRADGYRYALEQLEALLGAETDLTAGLANASALIMLLLPDLNWAGFYFLEDGRLVLGPFQGKPACIEIPVGRGVCGTAVAEDRTQLVPDVHLFPGHIACDSASNSELVVPLRVHGQTVGVLDLDSPWPGRFTGEDRDGLEAFAELVGQMLERC